MSREHKFEIIEHTADVGVIGAGTSRAEAFENVAYGMFSIMADLGNYLPAGFATVEAEGDDDIDLLERFLSSLIVIFDSEGVLPLDFEINEVSDKRLACKVSVRPIGDDIEWLGPTIKAVTYHQMDVTSTDTGWRAQAIFDV